MKRKVCVVITARPSYSRIRTALKAFQEHDDIELQIVAATSALLYKYGQIVKVIQKDGFQVTESVYNLIEGESLITSAKTTGLGIIELSGVFDRLKPDMVVTIADRYETIATAIAAAYLNIPLVHIQGGEVTGNIDEKVRHAITKLSDIHLVATEKARERVIRMGENPDSVHVTGCPSIDIVQAVLDEDNGKSFDILSKYSGVGMSLPNRSDYIVVLQHPVTTEIESASEQIRNTYNALSDMPIQIYWFWPNSDSGSDEVSKTLRKIRENEKPNNLLLFKNVMSDDFIRLMNGAKCIVGNSSAAIREASYLGVPAINIGSRQAGRERGRNVTDVSYNSDEIRAAVQSAIDRNQERKGEQIYGDGKAGQRIAELLASTELTSEKRLYF